MSYKLNVNHEGTDYLISVDDIETATLLINDGEASHQFMEQLLERNGTSTNAAASTQVLMETNGNVEESSKGQNSVLNEERHSGTHKTSMIIWTSKKATATDNDATLILLDCRKQMEKQFCDRKTRKTKLWSDIAHTLIKAGYDLGDQENAGERCRQKFSNLQKAYTNYTIHQKTTGTENIDPPSFFDEVHAIIGDKHKINPSYLQDSLEAVDPKLGTLKPQGRKSDLGPSKSEKLIKDSDSDLDEPQILNRFSRPRKSGKPSKKHDVIEEIREDRKKREEEFNVFQSHLKKSEQQRDRLLEILEKSLCGKKRKREETHIADSDSE